MLHTYSLFQIPAAMVGGIACGIAYGIYHFAIKTPQPALPGPPAPTVGTINVKGFLGSVSLSI